MTPPSGSLSSLTPRPLRVLALLLIAVPLAPLGCKKQATETPEVVVSVKAEHPASGPISETIAADAILAPLAQAAISPRISSPIRAEYVQRGARVRKGQLLLTLEARDLEGAALDTEGGVDSAEAALAITTRASIPEDAQKVELDVAQAKANLDVAQRTAADRRRLFDQGALSGRDADTAFAASVQAQATYDAAVKHRASVLGTTGAASAKAAQGALSSARGRHLSAAAQVSYASLRSPINGVVTDRPLFPGETAQAGAAVLTVMDTSSLLAKLHLAQASAQKLAVGGSAGIQIPGVSEPVAATISFISPALDPGSTTVEIWLKLPNGDGRFKVGTPVHAMLRGTTAVNALQVPSAALLPSTDGAGASVMITGEDGLAHRRAVTLGIRNAEAVQITGGLNPGDTVITEGSYGLDDGTKVTTKEGAAAEESGSGKPSAAAEDKD